MHVKDWTIAPLICLEAIQPGMVAARAAAGADLLVNLSNDSWFDRGAGPEQHLALAALGAPLVRRPLVRVATTGISGLVGAEGLVSWRLPTGTGAVALLDVVPPRTDSLFVHGGGAGTTLFLLMLAATAVVLPGRVRAAAARSDGGDA
jgi:apolipoprotein N-acyltransferase